MPFWIFMISISRSEIGAGYLVEKKDPLAVGLDQKEGTVQHLQY